MDLFQRYLRQSSILGGGKEKTEDDINDIDQHNNSNNNNDVEFGSSIRGSHHQHHQREPLLQQQQTSSSSSNTTAVSSSNKKSIEAIRSRTNSPSSLKQQHNNIPPIATTTIVDTSSTAAIASGQQPVGGNSKGSSSTTTTTTSSSGISKIGYAVLILLAVQNCSKNLLMRYVMKDKPQFLTSTAVLCCECMKLTMSVLYILFQQKKSYITIIEYLQYDMRNTLLLAVPATAYNLQMKLEYVALANLNAAIFSVLVQTKLLFTAIMAVVFLSKQLKYIQIISLVLLTVGVMLCNMSGSSNSTSSSSSILDSTAITGIMATIGIAISSGFASVYTEKVIKATSNSNNVILTKQNTIFDRNEYGLAYTQVQLAFMSICTIGLYAIIQDYNRIMEVGLFYQFNFAAVCSIINSAIGGLIVASVLKYADSVLKGYATAMSVILTGILSMILFGTSLSIIYFLGIINVVVAVLLYNGKDLDQLMC